MKIYSCNYRLQFLCIKHLSSDMGLEFTIPSEYTVICSVSAFLLVQQVGKTSMWDEAEKGNVLHFFWPQVK